MRIKTSITLAAETLEAVDEIAGADSNRSRVIEEAVVEFIRHRRRQQREARDLAILNRVAEDLNLELDDILDYQTEP